MWHRHHDRVPVGVIDVGSNTVRLLVTAGGQTAAHGAGRDRPRRRRRRARPHPGRQARPRRAAVVESFADLARRNGATRLEVLITSPGRQAANGDELLDALAAAAKAPASILTAPEEARLAFVGALAGGGPMHRQVAVVDVGGGSAQVVVGTRATGPTWIRSLDIGSLRLLAPLPPRRPTRQSGATSRRVPRSSGSSTASIRRSRSRRSPSAAPRVRCGASSPAASGRRSSRLRSTSWRRPRRSS